VHPVVCSPLVGVGWDSAVRWEEVVAHTVVVPAAGQVVQGSGEDSPSLSTF
jgi:hypothetical protein